MNKLMTLLVAVLLALGGAAQAQDKAKTDGKAAPAASAPAKADAKAPAKADAKAPAKADAKAPAKADAKAPAKADAKADAAGLIDINSASAAELATLPGIGEARSAAIVKGRPYKRKDELVQKKVLTQSVYDGIKEKIIAKQKA